MRNILILLFLSFVSPVWSAVMSGGSSSGATSVGLYPSNVCFISGVVGTNLIYASGAGTSIANGLYSFKGTVGSPGVHIYTNANGQTGIALDHSLGTYAQEYNITNTSASVLYGAGELSPEVWGAWFVVNGASAAPTVVYGTNYFTNCYTQLFPVDGYIPYATTFSTNILYVNQTTSLGDSNAVIGRIDRPWLTVSNALAAARSNQTVFVFPGNYTSAIDSVSFIITNNVSLIGFDPRLVQVGPSGSNADIAFNLKTNATMRNISGNFDVILSGPNITLSSLYATGNIDCLQALTGSDNYEVNDCYFAVNGHDLSGNIIDAAVLSHPGGVGRIRNSWFISRHSLGTAATAPAIRRAVVLKSGTVFFQGGGVVAKDSGTNFGFAFTGDAASTMFLSPDVQSDVSTTNSWLALGITNSASGTPAVVVLSGTLPFPIGKIVGAVTYSNAFPASNIFGSFPTITGNGSGITNNWVMTPLFGGIQNVQLQNGNRFASAIGGNGATNLGFIVASPLPSGGYLSNLSVFTSTNSFSTTNYTFTLLTNNNPTAGVASLLTGVLLGATASPSTNFGGVSCILTANTNTMGTMQILNSVANSTAPMSFWWRMEWWHQQGNP